MVFARACAAFAVVPVNSAGKALFTTPDLSSKTHSITAIYSSNATRYADSKSSPLAQRVN